MRSVVFNRSDRLDDNNLIFLEVSYFSLNFPSFLHGKNELLLMERGDAVKNFMEEFRETAPLCSRKQWTVGLTDFIERKIRRSRNF